MDKREEQAQEAAYLYAQRFSQQQLAGIFNCSQSHISRLLKLAEERGWLKYDTHFDEKGIPQRRLDEIRRRMEPKTLALQLRALSTETRVQVRHVRVYASTFGDFDDQLVRFGRLAAGRATELIEKSSVLGVIFSETVHRVIDGIAWSGLRPRTNRPVTVIPVAGEVASYVRVGSSSSWLASRLHELINNNDNQQYSLSAVPFLIPTHFERSTREAISKWIQDLPGYRKIFGGEPSMVSRMDCVFTSVGQDGKPLSAAIKELTEIYGITPSRLREIAATDIGATLVPTDLVDEDAEAKAELEALNSVMINLTIDQYRDVCQRAADPAMAPDKQPSGVCLFAIGANKARGLLTVLRKGLVNELIIDEELARELTRLLEPVRQTEKSARVL